MSDLLTVSKIALQTLEHHEADITYLPPLQIIEELRKAIAQEEQRRARAEPLHLEIYRILFSSDRINSAKRASEAADEIAALINAAQAAPDEAPTMYFMTVEWCSDKHRGVFCSKDGTPFRKDGEPHTNEEMDAMLGPFWLILGAKSQPFTQEEITEYTYFRPLAEYKDQYGIALRKVDIAEKYHLPKQEEIEP